MKLTVYCDGSCVPNPGRGSFAFVVLNDAGASIYESSAACEYSTNNREEIKGALNGLRWCLENSATSIQIFSDSQYVINAASDWIYAWHRRGWAKKKSALLNSDLWRELFDLIVTARDRKICVDWQWVRGHNGDEWNEYVDGLAEHTRLTSRRPAAR